MHRHAVVSLILSGLLLYGGLFPLHGWHSGNAIAFLTEHQPVRSGLDDLLVNVLVFMPLGFVSLLALNERYRLGRSLVLAVLHGMVLSFAIEAFQAFLPMRYSSLSDLMMNTLGTALGSAAGALLRQRSRRTPLRTGADWYHDPLLRLLAISYGAWALAPLLPFNPVTDMEALRTRLQWLTAPPTAAHPWSLSSTAAGALALFGLGSLWRAVAATPGARLYAMLLLPVIARLVVGEEGLPMADLTGALLGMVGLWALTATDRRRLALTALTALCAGLVLTEVLPGASAAYRAFNWIPFRAHLQDPVLGIEALLEGIWVTVALTAAVVAAKGPLRWPTAAAITLGLAAAIFILELQQVRLPGRLPDITLAVVMALTCLLAFASLGSFRSREAGA